MARLVKTVEGQLVKCNITTIFADGTRSVKELSVGDIVEGLRYIENAEVKTVSGRVSAINTVCENVTSVNMSDPKDYFSEDVVPTTIDIDASEQYKSKLVSVNAREIVEDAGVVNVVKVDVSVVPEITLEMSYTDSRIVQQDVVVGDVLCDMDIMTAPRKPDITGDFRVAAFIYSTRNYRVTISGMYLVSLETGDCVKALFTNIISFEEKTTAVVTATDSLAQISTALAEEDEVFAFFENDVTVPLRDDGRIVTVMINAGKKLTVDLSGHALNTQAYAFYVNGGELVIRDTTGEGVITACAPNNAYPVIQVTADGVCTMESGTIDTTQWDVEEGQCNWLYGVVCSGNGIFNMTGGLLKTQDAAGISITNGTATGEGAKFNISGTATITANDCTAIYLADNKEVNISDNAVINGGILLRMGDLNVSGNAVVNGTPAGTDVYPLGRLVCESGCENHNAAILAMTGCYGSTLGNDMNINISEFARVNGFIDNAIDIATLNTRYNQKVNISLKSGYASYVSKLWNIYTHQELAGMATAQGKTLPPETSTTTLTIKVDGTKVYPRV